MFGYTKKNALDALSGTKLYLPMVEIHLFELARIEMLAEVWLKSAGIDYSKLENAKAWLVLVGAWFSMRYANQFHAIKTSRSADGVEEAFGGLLKQGIPVSSFRTICREIDTFQHSPNAMDLKASLKSKCGFNDFEAHVRMMAISIACGIVPESNEDRASKVEDALYQFFLRAQDDYFQGQD